MDAVIRGYNEFVELAVTSFNRLLELPVLVLLGGSLALFLSMVILVRAIGKRRGSSWLRGASLRWSVVLFGVIALLLLSDQRTKLVLDELRSIRAELARRPADHGMGITGSTGLLFDRDTVELAIKRAIPGADMVTESRGAAVSYANIRAEKPEEIQLHVAVIDLTYPGLEICITPEFGEKWLTSDFARIRECLVAVNGEAGMTPAKNSGFGHWIGNWVVRGEPILMEDTDERPFLSFDRRNRACYFPEKIVDTKVTPQKYNTIWGRFDILLAGRIVSDDIRKEPRCCMGINAKGDRLVLFVADGRRPGHSVGMGLVGIARLMAIFGATDAMSCDQGGSACMYLDSRGGIVSVPSDGRERATYNHFGVAVRD